MKDKLIKEVSGSYLVHFHFPDILTEYNEIIVQSHFHPELSLHINREKMEAQLIKEYRAFGLGEYGEKEKEILKTIKISEVDKHTITLDEAIQL